MPVLTLDPISIGRYSSRFSRRIRSRPPVAEAATIGSRPAGNAGQRVAARDARRLRRRSQTDTAVSTTPPATVYANIVAGHVRGRFYSEQPRFCHGLPRSVVQESGWVAKIVLRFD